MQLFLDCDGVLADFDSFAAEIMGMNPREFERQKGAGKFWSEIYSTQNFFTRLPKMHDADILVESVRHLNPIILTGTPRQGEDMWATKQKLAWRDIHFPDLHMITCESKDKFLHHVPNKHNVIVDDWPQHKQVWEDNGGTFIVHTSAEDSLRQLRELGVI